jgi:hypothetical protein
MDSKISALNAHKVELIQKHSSGVLVLQDSLKNIDAMYRGAIQKLEDEARAISSQLQSVSNDSTLNSLKLKLSALKAKEEALKQEILRNKVEPGSKCPTCGQVIDENTLKQHLNETNGFETREKEIADTIDVCNTEISSLEIVNNSLKERFTKDLDSKNSLENIKDSGNSLIMKLPSHKSKLSDEIN